MKNCPKCHKNKDIIDFKLKYPNRPNCELRLSWCRACDTTYHIKKKRDKKLAAVIYKGGKCVSSTCPLPKNYELDVSCFDFHHRDPNTKDFSWSSMKGKTWEVIKVEIDKCDLLCCLCHRLIHSSAHKPGESQIRENKNYTDHFWGTPVTIGGETKNITEWARCFDLSRETLKRRVKRGMSLVEAITTPSRSHVAKDISRFGRQITIDDETMNIESWCRRLNINHKTYSTRVYTLGWDPVRALTTPTKTGYSWKREKEGAKLLPSP